MPDALNIQPGDRFNKLTAVRELDPIRDQSGRYRQFLWRCDCGREVVCRLGQVVHGRRRICGEESCRRQVTRPNKKVATPGERFGRWTVVEDTNRKPGPNGSRPVLCRCDCGTEREVNWSSLVNGRSSSCGCLRKELLSESMKRTWQRRRAAQASA
jgi:hypothetical protein